MRKSSYAAGVVGVLLIVAALIVAFVVAPALIKLPSDTNDARTFGGTAATLLNPVAVANGDVAHAVLHNVPIVATHHTKVIDTNSDSALIEDTHALSAGGATVASSTFRYAVNRKNMGRGSGFTNTTAQTGLTFNFPIHTQKHDYTGWVSDTGKPTTLKYTGTAKRGGQDVYTFAVNTEAAPLTDPHLLASLPKVLPKAAIPALAAANGVSPTLLASVQPLLAALPANVPLAYTYQVQGTLYAAPASGVVVDVQQHEVRSVGLAGAQGLPTFPVADLTYTSTPESLSAAAKDASDKGDSINLLESTLPWALGIGGAVLVLLGAGGIVMSNRRRDAEVIDAPTGSAIPTPRETPTDAPAKTDL